MNDILNKLRALGAQFLRRKGASAESRGAFVAMAELAVEPKVKAEPEPSAKAKPAKKPKASEPTTTNTDAKQPRKKKNAPAVAASAE